MLTYAFQVLRQSNYESIEAEFQKDEQRWEEDLKKEQEKPSEFEGGSMAPADHNMRMTAFVESHDSEDLLFIFTNQFFKSFRSILIVIFIRLCCYLYVNIII